jgi:hypothetical protein
MDPERVDDAVRHALNASKDEFAKREALWTRNVAKKKRKTPAPTGSAWLKRAVLLIGCMAVLGIVWWLRHR